MVFYLTVRTKPRSYRDEVEEIVQIPSGGWLCVVRVRAIAKEGEANEAVRRVLADFFDVAFSEVRLIKGHTARLKKFEIEGDINKLKKISTCNAF